jgi:tetratricopeptide (TPR) repeat protein
VKKQQVIVAASGFLLLIVVYFFGQTTPPQKSNVAEKAKAFDPAAKPIITQDILQALKAKLSPSQLTLINSLEHSVVRGDIKNQQIKTYSQLAEFWKDSVRDGFIAYAYYTGQTAKLENSEKKLTFAAQLFLDNLRGQDDPALKIWMADNAKELFEKALQLNPDNDSSKIGLGASYIFGSTAGSGQEVMQGIQRIVEVARRDSTNMYAQFMLGLGGAVSGQFDKAIGRLTKVVQQQPNNIEAILTLADIYEKKGNKTEAIKWYQEGRRLVADEKIVKEIDERIKLLQ